MPIPEFNQIKAPALQFFADGNPHKVAEVFDKLALHFSLTTDEQNEMLPSGTQRRWHNRANWACYDLYRAGLLERPKRGLYAITDLGKRVAAQKPTLIDREYLMQFPQFAQWIVATDESRETGRAPADMPTRHPEGGPSTDRTPEEMISTAFQTLRATLKRDVLELVRKMDPYRFEKLVIDLLVAMGYGGSRDEAAQVTKASGDEGIDGIINEDRLGLDVIYIQAKRWQSTVGRPDLQTFVGALAGKQAHKGIFITTSEFNSNAVTYAKQVPQKVSRSRRVACSCSGISSLGLNNITFAAYEVPSSAPSKRWESVAIILSNCRLLRSSNSLVRPGVSKEYSTKESAAEYNWLNMDRKFSGGIVRIRFSILLD